MITTIKAEDLRKMQGKEGLILQGCGGDPQEWLDGINEMLTDAKVLIDGTKFSDVSVFEHEGLTNILFPFSNELIQVNSLYGGLLPMKTSAALGSRITLRTISAASKQSRKKKPNPTVL